MNVKNSIIGGVGVLSGITLFGFTLVAASIYALELSSIGYSRQFGLYGSALIEIGIVPLIISATLFITGLGFFYKNVDKEWKSKYFLVEETLNGQVRKEDTKK
ncbi:hypothetical protein I858_016035 [Planococcus versutus]|uniref:Uncharacterized protein n=1 Tax=Planococcus versutus TaxID=1302659 RepID=A0A1B1S5N1_9BACL|nr:hypothetical protein I858_016035 [Planococcus versutus]